MDRFVARQNVERYEELLRREQDPDTRAQIAKLLAEAQAELEAANKRAREARGR